MIDVEEILSKMNPNQKINYDRVMQKMVQVWEKNEQRPTILMHDTVIINLLIGVHLTQNFFYIDHVLLLFLVLFYHIS